MSNPNREQLIEIMARATARWRLGGVASDLGRWVMHDQEMMTCDAELLRQLRAHPHRVAVALCLLRVWWTAPTRRAWHEQLRQVARDMIEDL